MLVYVFKYYILILFLSYSGMVMKSFPSAGHLLLNLQRMLATEKVNEWLTMSPGCMYADILIHEMQMPSSISDDSMQC